MVYLRQKRIVLNDVTGHTLRMWMGRFKHEGMRNHKPQNNQRKQFSQVKISIIKCKK